MYSVLAIVAAGLSLASAAATSKKFTFYEVKTPLAGPCDLWNGPDGNIWVDTLLANKIVKVNPSTGKVHEYSIPYKSGLLPTSVLPSDAQGRVALACVVQPGEDGRMYFATGLRDQIARIDIATDKVEVFGFVDLAGNLEPLNDAWPGPEGMFFSQTSGNVITLFDYNTTKFTNFPLPQAGSGPVGMRIASDGALWFTEFLGNRIGRLNFTDGTFKEYDVPLPSLAGPGVMRVETQGKYLWFTALDASSMGRIDIYTGEMKAFPITNGALLPVEDTSDSKGNVWFTSLTNNALNYLTPSTGKFTAVTVPGTVAPVIPVSLPPHGNVAIHYVEADDSMWFTELAQNRIGKYALS